MLFERRIKEKRKLLNLTQKELGNKMGVTKVSICNWEKGIKFPSTDNLIKLSEILQVPLDYLIGNEIDVISDHTLCTFKMAQDEIDIISELRKHINLYEMLLDNPKRTMELIEKKLF